MCSGWCSKGGSSGSMQCVWKEGGRELNPLHNMWLLGTRAKFRSARKFDIVKLECVYEFVYLSDMLNDTDGVEQAVATRVRAVWMKFKELGGILCTQGASLRMKGVVYKACVCSMLTYGAETWAMKAGVFQRL